MHCMCMAWRTWAPIKGDPRTGCIIAAHLNNTIGIKLKSVNVV
jgi:hypothetical protein